VKKTTVGILAAVFVACSAAMAGASVFSGVGGGALQSVFNELGYDQIDASNYQTDLNFRMEGLVQFELLSRGGVENLSFGVLETKRRRWGRAYRHHRLFGRDSGAGTLATFRMDHKNSTYGFYVNRRSRNGLDRRGRFYSFSPFNRRGAVQALFFEDPNQAGSYLLAWEGIYVGNPRSDRRYDDLVVRMTIHPAPEPATWALLGSGLLGVGLFFGLRRRSGQAV